MPDRDVFNRRVKRDWQTAARRMIGNPDDPDALPLALHALGKEIKSNGCPGVDQIVHVVAEAVVTLDSSTARQQALERLDSIRLHHGNGNTEVAVASARRLIARRSSPDVSAFVTMGDGELQVHLTILILADLTDASMCPAPHLGEIVEEGKVSFQAVVSRRQRAKELIAAAPDTRRLAIQLLADPSGASVQSPRIRRAKQSQAEILVTALTE